MMNQRLHALTAQITKMTPPQRQQFATLHKNDPIIIGLTKHINDQENALRSSLKAQMNPEALAPKPTIVDQTIAGLAGMPAPALENMPDGGIAGPGENSHPQGYADGGRVRKDLPMGIPLTGIDTFQPKIIATPDVSQFMDSGARPKPRSKLEQEREKNMALAHAEGQNRRPTMVNDPRMLGAVPPISSGIVPTQVVGAGELPPEEAEPQVRGGGGGGGGGHSSIPMPTPPATSGGSVDIAGEYGRYMSSLPRDPFAKETAELNEAEKAAAKANRESVEKDQSEMGIAGLEREKRLKSREEKLNKKEGQNKGMALLEAGLAMMAGKSRHAMVNIGEGALVGTKRFREGEKEIEEAREKIDDALSNLEDLRRNEKRMDKKELREAYNQERAAAVGGLARIHKVIQEQYGVNAKTAAAMLQGGIQMAMNQQDNATRQYTAQLGYKGGIDQANIHAGATMGAARLRNSADKAARNLERDKFNMLHKSGQLVALEEDRIEKRVADANKAAMESRFTPLTAQEKNAIRTQMWNDALAKNPFLKQAIGSYTPQAAPAQAVPGIDASQWNVREKSR